MLYCAAPFPPQNCSFLLIHCFLGTRATTPNSTSIHSAIFQNTRSLSTNGPTDGQTDRTNTELSLYQQAAFLTLYALSYRATQTNNSLVRVHTNKKMKVINIFSNLNIYKKQEAFEKCWAHSPLRAAACPNFTLPFTRCRYCRTPPLSHAACASMSTTTTTTTRDRGDRYGTIEWAK